MHNLLKNWSNGKQAINGWLSIPNSFSAEIMASANWDSLTIDCQHGMISFSQAFSMLQTISSKQQITPLVRIPWLREETCMQYLDAGAMGLICPMIETAKDVKDFVSFSTYPPNGTRSFGPTRAVIIDSDYYKTADKNIIRLAMIETPKAFENLDEICQVEGLSGVYVGPADLALSHGFAPGFDREEPELLHMINKILETAQKNNKKACLHTGSAAYANRALKMGFDLVTISNDVRLLKTAVSQVFAELKR